MKIIKANLRNFESTLKHNVISLIMLITFLIIACENNHKAMKSQPPDAFKQCERLGRGGNFGNILYRDGHFGNIIYNNNWDKEKEQKEMFLSTWKQIAEHFKDYPDNVYFGVLNEPNGNLTPYLWNYFCIDAINVIRVSNP